MAYPYLFHSHRGDAGCVVPQRTGKFHVGKGQQAQFEVDNDLHGFSRQPEDINVNGGSETSKP